MFRKLIVGAAGVAVSSLMVTGGANATLYLFGADLNVENEVSNGTNDENNASQAHDTNEVFGSGTGRMIYNDGGTVGDSSDDTLSYRIDFNGLSTLNDGATTQLSQAHFHLGQAGVNNSIFLDLDDNDDVPPPNETPLATAGFVDLDDAVASRVAAQPPVGFIATDFDLGNDEQGTPLDGGAFGFRYDTDDIVANLLAYALDLINGTNLTGRNDNDGTDNQGQLNADGTIDTNWYINLHTDLTTATSVAGAGHIRDQWHFIQVLDVPEPGALTLLGAGLLAAGYVGRRRIAS